MNFPSHHRILGVISGMIVWAVWFVAIYALNGVGCVSGWQQVAIPGGNLLSALKLGTVLVALALIGWCAWRGYRGYRQGCARASQGNREAAQRERFMGMVMLVLSLLAAVATILGGIPVLMLLPCAS